MIIGIGGVSRAGKSTLADLLAKLYVARGHNVKILHQDDYVHMESEIPQVGDRIDWESPESIRFDAFRQAVLKAKLENDLVIAEGLLCFYDPVLRAKMDRRIFVTINKSVFLKRKKEDLRWGSTPDPDWYIEHIWKSYEQYGSIKAIEDYFTIDGSQYFDLITVTQYLLIGQNNS